MLIGYLYTFFGEMSIQVLALFLIGLFWFFAVERHPSGGEVVSHCGFDLHFPDD